MSHRGPWITVAEAALIAKRTPATIYNWIRHGRLYTATGTGGITLVRGDAVLEVESRVKLGRPAGADSSRYWR